MTSSFSPWSPAIQTEGNAHYTSVPRSHLERVKDALHKHNIEHTVLESEIPADTPDASMFEFAAEHSVSDLLKILTSL